MTGASGARANRPGGHPYVKRTDTGKPQAEREVRRVRACSPTLAPSINCGDSFLREPLNVLYSPQYTQGGHT
jgi:hypothetical protein